MWHKNNYLILVAIYLLKSFLWQSFATDIVAATHEQWKKLVNGQAERGSLSWWVWSWWLLRGRNVCGWNYLGLVISYINCTCGLITESSEIDIISMTLCVVHSHKHQFSVLSCQYLKFRCWIIFWQTHISTVPTLLWLVVPRWFLLTMQSPRWSTQLLLDLLSLLIQSVSFFSLCG